MHARSIRHEIERLLAEGQLSRRAIARRLGVSRTVVRTIAMKTARHRQTRRLPFNHRRQQRCPSCGYLVPLPCVYCRAKAYHAHRCADLQLMRSD